jgi:putative drug exporter of the RND superfamily
MGTVARWCFRHRWAVVLLWLGVLAGVVAARTALGTAFSNEFTVPGTESSRALEEMRRALPQAAGDTDTVVWRVDDGSVRDAGVRARMTAALTAIERLPDVGSVLGPYEEAGAGQVSGDGQTAYAQVTFSKPATALDPDDVRRVIDTAQAAATDRLRVELGGQAIALTQRPPLGLAEGVGLLAAAVVLFVAFGSLFATLLPIMIAIFGVGTGVTSIGLLTHLMKIADTAPLVGSLIGLGVGIDYALFIVSRHRRGIQRGATPAESAVRAVDTSGRAVLFAGATVCVALLGLFVLGTGLLNGVAVAASLTVLMNVAAAVTLLPAMFGILGARVLSRRQRRALPPTSQPPGPGGVGETARLHGLSARWSAFVERHPTRLVAVAVAVMATLAVPLLSLPLGTTDQGNDPASTTTRRAYDLLTDGFGPGFNGPLQLVASVPTPGARAAVGSLLTEVRDTPGVARATVLPVPGGTGISIISVVPTTSPQDADTDALIDRLRDDTIPRVTNDSGLHVDIGGVTAINKDFAGVLAAKLPLFILVIVGLGFLLLLVAFRSLVVPLTAAVMNLLAAAAAFGVLVAFFQWGWITGLLGIGGAVPITSFLPVTMLALLFGLSMDYQVFLISRMHEEWVHTGDNRRAVRTGLTETSRVITSAAAIMICVFSAFALSGNLQGAMAGLGLAMAVALDAFILRTVLVPALMYLIGRPNWWLPAWLDRLLPHLAIDPPDPPDRPGQVGVLR